MAMRGRWRPFRVERALSSKQLAASRQLVIGETDAGGVGDAPAGILISADGSLFLGNAADGNGLTLPAIETKDVIRFCDYLPTL
jgi:hypothetical protein